MRCKKISLIGIFLFFLYFQLFYPTHATSDREVFMGRCHTCKMHHQSEERSRTAGIISISGEDILIDDIVIKRMGLSLSIQQTNIGEWSYALAGVTPFSEAAFELGYYGTSDNSFLFRLFTMFIQRVSVDVRIFGSLTFTNYGINHFLSRDTVIDLDFKNDTPFSEYISRGDIIGALSSVSQNIVTILISNLAHTILRSFRVFLFEKIESLINNRVRTLNNEMMPVFGQLLYHRKLTDAGIKFVNKHPIILEKDLEKVALINNDMGNACVVPVFCSNAVGLRIFFKAEGHASEFLSSSTSALNHSEDATKNGKRTVIDFSDTLRPPLQAELSLDINAGVSLEAILDDFATLVEDSRILSDTISQTLLSFAEQSRNILLGRLKATLKNDLLDASISAPRPAVISSIIPLWSMWVTEELFNKEHTEEEMKEWASGDSKKKFNILHKPAGIAETSKSNLVFAAPCVGSVVPFGAEIVAADLRSATKNMKKGCILMRSGAQRLDGPLTTDMIKQLRRERLWSSMEENLTTEQSRRKKTFKENSSWRPSTNLLFTRTALHFTHFGVDAGTHILEIEYYAEVSAKIDIEVNQEIGSSEFELSASPGRIVVIPLLLRHGLNNVAIILKHLHIHNNSAIVVIRGVRMLTALDATTSSVEKKTNQKTEKNPDASSSGTVADGSISEESTSVSSSSAARNSNSLFHRPDRLTFEIPIREWRRVAYLLFVSKVAFSNGQSQLLKNRIIREWLHIRNALGLRTQASLGPAPFERWINPYNPAIPSEKKYNYRKKSGLFYREVFLDTTDARYVLFTGLDIFIRPGIRLTGRASFRNSKLKVWNMSARKLSMRFYVPSIMNLMMKETGIDTDVWMEDDFSFLSAPILKNNRELIEKAKSLQVKVAKGAHVLAEKTLHFLETESSLSPAKILTSDNTKRFGGRLTKEQLTALKDYLIKSGFDLYDQFFVPPPGQDIHALHSPVVKEAMYYEGWSYDWTKFGGAKFENEASYMRLMSGIRPDENDPFYLAPYARKRYMPSFLANMFATLEAEGDIDLNHERLVMQCNPLEVREDGYAPAVKVQFPTDSIQALMAGLMADRAKLNFASLTRLWDSGRTPPDQLAKFSKKSALYDISSFMPSMAVDGDLALQTLVEATSAKRSLQLAVSLTINADLDTRFIVRSTMESVNQIRMIELFSFGSYIHDDNNIVPVLLVIRCGSLEVYDVSRLSNGMEWVIENSRRFSYAVDGFKGVTSDMNANLKSYLMREHEVKGDHESQEAFFNRMGPSAYKHLLKVPNPSQENNSKAARKSSLTWRPAFQSLNRQSADQEWTEESLRHKHGLEMLHHSIAGLHMAFKQDWGMTSEYDMNIVKIQYDDMVNAIISSGNAELLASISSLDLSKDADIPDLTSLELPGRNSKIVDREASELLRFLMQANGIVESSMANTVPEFQFLKDDQRIQKSQSVVVSSPIDIVDSIDPSVLLHVEAIRYKERVKHSRGKKLDASWLLLESEEQTRIDYERGHILARNKMLGFNTTNLYSFSQMVTMGTSSPSLSVVLPILYLMEVNKKLHKVTVHREMYTLWLRAIRLERLRSLHYVVVQRINALKYANQDAANFGSKNYDFTHKKSSGIREPHPDKQSTSSNTCSALSKFSTWPPVCSRNDLGLRRDWTLRERRLSVSTNSQQEII